MKESTEIRGDPHRIFIFSWKPLLGAREKLSLEGGSGPGARAAVAAAVPDFEAAAPFPGTCRENALMQPTTCTVSSGLSRERVDNSLQAPVHNEESEKICRSENLESVTSVNLVRNEGNKTQPFTTIWGEKVSTDKGREVEMWDIFKDLTEEYLEECRTTNIDGCSEMPKTELLTGDTSSKQKCVRDSQLRDYFNTRTESYPESPEEGYYDVDNLTDYETMSSTELDYLSGSDNSDNEEELDRWRFRDNSRVKHDYTSKGSHA